MKTKTGWIIELDKKKLGRLPIILVNGAQQYGKGQRLSQWNEKLGSK